MIHDTYVILHNIRSAYNVGSIFRTADAAGVSKIYLTGYTPLPTDKFGRKRKEVAKVALGAEKTVQWEQGEIEEVMRTLKKEGVEVAAVEQAPEAVDFRDYEGKSPRTFIFGNEVEGIEENILEQSDVILEIPMRGEKRSLNVAVAAGIVLFRQ